MQGLLELSEEKPAHYDRFQKALMSIKGQIQRGQDLIANLNRFSHGPDIAVCSLDLFEGVNHLVSLSQRFAALKNVSLKVIQPHRLNFRFNSQPTWSICKWFFSAR